MDKTVIFDFDGTLANSIDMVMNIYNRMAPEFGSQQVDRSEFNHLRKLGYKKAMKAKGIRWSYLPKMVIAITREMKSHMNEVKPYPGIVELLTELRAKNYKTGILTSNQEPLVNEFLKTHNFPPFDFLVCEKTIFGKDKALKKILRRRQISTGSVVYVGDEPRDVTACRKVGIPVIGVSWGLAGVEGFSDEMPDTLVDDASSLLEAIVVI